MLPSRAIEAECGKYLPIVFGDQLSRFSPGRQHWEPLPDKLLCQNQIQLFSLKMI